LFVEIILTMASLFTTLRSAAVDGLQVFREMFFGSRRGIRDVITLMIPQAVSVIVGLATSIAAARGLGPSGLGAYALVMSLSGIALALSDLGIGQTAVRYASRAVARQDVGGQHAILRWAFRIRLVLTALVTGALYLAAPVLASKVWHVEGLAPLLRLGLLSGVFAAIASVPNIYFQSLKMFQRTTIVTVGQTLISLAGILIVAWANAWSVHAVILATLVGNGIGALVFLLMVPRTALFTGTEGFLPTPERIRNLLRGPSQKNDVGERMAESAPGIFAGFNLISTLVVMAVIRLDVWMMGIFLTDGDIGVYNVGARLAMPLAIILNAINAALWPRASAVRSVPEAVRMLRQTFRLSVVVAALALLYALIVPLLAPSLFGAAYARSVGLGQLLSLRYAFAILICPIGVVGYSLGMVRVYWWINIIQLVAVFLVNYLFLPHFGPTASALALLANEAIGVTLAGIMIARRIRGLKE
jgi:O-antigen/teichoic acid export membrane protein